MTTLAHDDGGYRFVPGISAYSGGVIAQPGHELHRVTLGEWLPWRTGFEQIDAHLASVGRPRAALCAVDLRCNAPHAFDGFGSFNDEYRTLLDSWGVLVDDHNPVARTNVAPRDDPPDQTVIHAFTYTAPIAATISDSASFVVAGAGDLADQSDLRPEAIVAPGNTTAEGMAAKGTCVLDEMESRMGALGVGWADVTVTDVYTVEPLHQLLGTALVPRMGPAARQGVVWHASRPPIAGLDFEMDLRGGCLERWI